MNQAVAAKDAVGPRQEWGALLAWVAVAGLLRFAGLERWSLWGDEAHTLIDALDLRDGNWRSSIKAYPLLYMMELAALKLWGSAASTEFALRSVTALSGTLAVGVLFGASRPLLGLRQRHALALLATFSPWLVYHSQFARFYGPLLLCSSMASLYYLRAMRSGLRSEMRLAVFCILIGGLTHPTCWILFIGLLASSLIASRFGSPMRPGLMVYPLGVVAAFVVILLFFFDDYVRTVWWKVLAKDAGADSPVDLAMGLVYNFGLAPMMLALLGLLASWRRSRRLGLEICVVVGLATAVVFFLAAMGTSVEQRYLIPVVPLLLIAAAIQLADLWEGMEGRMPLGRWVIPLLAVLPFVPALVSNYADGNRHDIRGAAEYLREHIAPEDSVVSEGHFLMQWYLPELSDERLLEAPPQFGEDEGIPELRAQEARMAREGGRLWVVVPTHFRDLGGDERAFLEWVTRQGHLEHELYHRRLDYHQNRLLVFVVDPSSTERWIPVEGTVAD